MAPYLVTARNFSQDHENRIHSDEVAQRFGFRGALVPGVAVYGHMTYPLVEQWGEPFLQQSSDQLRLLKPAYHGDALSIELGSDNTVTCHNPTQTVLATLNASLGAAPPQDDMIALLNGPQKTAPRSEIDWQGVHAEEVFAPWELLVDQPANQRYTSEVADPLPCYQNFAHPHLLLSVANQALTREYVMPSWIHVGSESTRHRAVRVGDLLTIRCVVKEKWRHKGHEFICLYVSMWQDDHLTTEVLHTAIFRIAQ